MDLQSIAQDNLLFKCIAGSYAYGTAIEGVSDVDYRGVFIAPIELIISCFLKTEQVSDSTQDVQIFELRKFLGLAVENNPNIIELLYMPEDKITFCHPYFKKIIQNQHLFLSKKAMHTFSGYAFAELKRIKGHNKWINNPKPETPPDIGAFCSIITATGSYSHNDIELCDRLSKSSFLVKTVGNIYRIYDSHKCFEHKLGFFNVNRNDIKYVDINQEILEKENATFIGILTFNSEEYRRQCAEHRHYWEWKTNRNKLRAELERVNNYDTKHAMHLIRLLTMGEEILATGTVNVCRTGIDADFLLDIRRGKFSYQEIVTLAEAKENKLQKLYETSSLQYSADLTAIDKLYREIIIDFWKNS